MDLADLQRLVDAFEASDWNEIHLAVDGVEVHLSATGGLPPAAGAAAPTAAGATAAASAPAVPALGSAGAAAFQLYAYVFQRGAAAVGHLAIDHRRLCQ